MKIETKDFNELGSLYLESVRGKSIDDLLTEKEGGDKTPDKVELKLKRKPETDEWVVQYIENGKVNDDKSYYTSDKEDAEKTMETMKKDLNKTITEGLSDNKKYLTAKELFKISDGTRYMSVYPGEKVRSLPLKYEDDVKRAGLSYREDKAFPYDDKYSLIVVFSDETLTEGLSDRIGTRFKATRDSAKDFASNIKKAGSNAMATMRGEKPQQRGKNIKYEYEKRKTKSIIDTHMKKFRDQLSDFATDLVKLGVASERDAERIAEQAFSSIERSKKLKSIKNLYEI